MNQDSSQKPCVPIRTGLSLRGWVWWYMMELPCYLWVSVCYRYRSWGSMRVPKRGPVLIVANHQSFLDPVVLGVSGHRRPFHAMARDTLFHNPVFGWLIRSLRAIPIDQEASDLRAMRACIGVLKRGEVLLIFPEGSRTEDGSTAPFAPGTMVLIKRARPMVVPVAIEGAHHAWPRGQTLPRATGRIMAMYGRPICADKLMAMGAERALAHLRDQIEGMRLRLKARGQA